MVTFKSTKRQLQKDFSQITDIEFLQKAKVELLDAFNMTVRHDELGLTKESQDRGFIVIVECDQATGFTPKDLFMGINIKHAIGVIDSRLNELYAE